MAYHLLTGELSSFAMKLGPHASCTGLLQVWLRKDEFNVVILGLDNAGKTVSSLTAHEDALTPSQTFLEKVKTTFTDTPGLDPDRIAPTIGQNIGRITLSSSVLQFWDLGGQRDIRAIWPKYYADCHAVCYVIDSTDKQRMEECWSLFGARSFSDLLQGVRAGRKRTDSIIADDRIEGVPTLVLANKQDDEAAIPVEDIKEAFNKHVMRIGVSEGAVLPISALEGCVVANPGS